MPAWPWTVPTVNDREMRALQRVRPTCNVLLAWKASGVSGDGTGPGPMGC